MMMDTSLLPNGRGNGTNETSLGKAKPLIVTESHSVQSLLGTILNKPRPIESTSVFAGPQLKTPALVGKEEIVTILPCTICSDLSSSLPNGSHSLGHEDWSGSVILDMLLAHAYAFHNNVSYYGACFPKVHPEIGTLVHAIDLEKDLFFPNCKKVL